MNEANDNLDEVKDENYELDGGLVKLEDLMPLLQREAINKGLKIFIFENSEIKEFFNSKRDDVGVILLAKNKDNALFNLKNLRRCYLVKI